MVSLKCFYIFLIIILNYYVSVDGKDRIVGGSTAEIANFPYQASLQVNGKHICGASILSEIYVLTAAHCVEGENAATLKIRVGSSYYAKGGQVVPVLEYHQHPKYVHITADYDVAILKLKERIVWNLAKPVKLIESGKYTPAGSKAVVSGWGYLKESGSSKAEQLQALTVPIISQDVCLRLYGKEKITQQMMCAGYLEGQKDACLGDSGGPLVINKTLIGIVSWGIGCARPNNPGVYTNVTVLRDFIKGLTGI